MTKDEIIDMAKEAGLVNWEVTAYANELERFAKLVVEHERSKYTKLIEEEMLSIKEAATQYGVSNEDSIGMLLFCEEFARVIAEKEREACAKACEEVIFKVKPTYCVVAENCVKVIRARGQ